MCVWFIVCVFARLFVLCVGVCLRVCLCVFVCCMLCVFVVCFVLDRIVLLVEQPVDCELVRWSVWPVFCLSVCSHAC